MPPFVFLSLSACFDDLPEVGIVTEPLTLADATTTDLDAPRVLRMSPPDGASGVMQGSPILLLFNEPMDPVTTEAALQATGATEVSWSPDGTQLQFELPLEYAEGMSTDNVPALEYTFGVTQDATDLAGNPLLASATATFTTARRLTTVLPYDLQRTGLGVNKQAGDPYPIGAGDTARNTEQNAVASWELDALPAGTLIHEEAALQGVVEVLEGDPGADLGDLWIEHISFPSLFFLSFAELVTPFPEPVLAADDAYGPGTPVQIDLTEALHNAVQADLDLLQIRMYFDDEVSADAEADGVYLHHLSTDLIVTALVR